MRIPTLPIVAGLAALCLSVSALAEPEVRAAESFDNARPVQMLAPGAVGQLLGTDLAQWNYRLAKGAGDQCGLKETPGGGSVALARLSGATEEGVQQFSLNSRVPGLVTGSDSKAVVEAIFIPLDGPKGDSRFVIDVHGEAWNDRLAVIVDAASDGPPFGFYASTKDGPSATRMFGKNELKMGVAYTVRGEFDFGGSGTVITVTASDEQGNRWGPFRHTAANVKPALPYETIGVYINSHAVGYVDGVKVLAE